MRPNPFRYYGGENKIDLKDGKFDLILTYKDI